MVKWSLRKSQSRDSGHSEAKTSGGRDGREERAGWTP